MGYTVTLFLKNNRVKKVWDHFIQKHSIKIYEGHVILIDFSYKKQGLLPFEK
jgi:hypothetical protein